MNKERMSHFLAIFCGIVVGALSAQSIADAFTIGKYFWFLGAALGGMVAWIGVDLPQFAKGTKLAVQHAWNQMIAWRSDREYWRFFGHSWLAVCAIFSSAWICFMSVLFVGVIDQPFFAAVYSLRMLIVATAAMLFLCSLLVAILEVNTQNRATHNETHKWVYRNFNPLSLIVWAIVGIFSLMRWVLLKAVPVLIAWLIGTAKQVPSATMITLRFLRRAAKLTFLYTNHERRTAGFVFAAIGASVGYFVGYVPIVALAGATFGVLEFELTKSLRARMQEDRVTT